MDRRSRVATSPSHTLNSPSGPFLEMPMEVVVDKPGSSKMKDRRSRITTLSSSRDSFNEISPSFAGQRQTSSLVLKFDVDGSFVFTEMSRVDVLRLAQEAATSASAPNQTVRTDSASRLPRNPSVPSGIGSAAPYGSVVDVQRVHARDIRKLHNAFSVSSEPSIELRNQGVLINADPLRAIIMRHCCLVFVPDGADSFVLILREMFHEVTHQDSSDVPFEFKALEALLATLCRFFKTDFERTAPVISTALDKLASGKISVRELEALREFKNRMQEFESQVDGVRRALMEILDDEEDMRLLYLTKLHEDPSLLHDLWSFDSEEAEVLIENYLQDIYSTRTKASLLQHRIQNTESLVMLKLDSTRNYLLGVDVFVSILTIAISIGTFVAGVFGMNLKSHLESTEGVFWGVTGVTILMMVMISLWGWLYFRHKGVFMWAALESNKTKE